ncbi:MAG TPA: universal stress protein [Tepidisphaeraceae bacterium]|nr:universal stress protein [Tepidisphaeraceae bacterium]
MKVLVAYDGSECSDVAIDDLGRAGLPGMGEAILLEVMEPVAELMDSPYAGVTTTIGWCGCSEQAVKELTERETEESQVEVAGAARRLRGVLPDWWIRTEVRTGHPMTAILKKADEWKPDLIVLGSHGRTGLDRMVMGRVSMGVLHHALTSVRICRGGRTPNNQPEAQPGKPIRLLVGVDASAHAAAAVRAIATRRWRVGTQVQVVGVVETRLPLAGTAAAWGGIMEVEVYAKIREEISRAVAEAARELSAAGLDVRQEVTSGQAGKILVGEAQKWQADCVFVGARGIGSLRRIFAGSVSSAVASHAHCSVEVVRSETDF